jgi:hypothetical protein
MPFPCDGLVPGTDTVYHRGIDVAAPAHLVYRWLCQLRVAPYSYDWIDNFGKGSPRRLIEGMDELRLGQKLLIGFDLVDFEPNRHITIRGDQRHVRVFGEMAATYLALPVKETSCRLLVRVVAKYPGGLHGWLLRTLLPIGDWLMMRKQLLTFKELAERSHTDGTTLSMHRGASTALASSGASGPPDGAAK